MISLSKDMRNAMFLRRSEEIGGRSLLLQRFQQMLDAGGLVMLET